MWRLCCDASRSGCALDNFHAWAKMLVAPAAPPPPVTAITPGTLWLDSQGNHLRAHSPGFHVEVDAPRSNTSSKATSATVFYMYGADRHFGRWAHGVCKVINVYSSTDLLNWSFRGIALDSNRYADRPKVVYSALTGQYVLWVKSTPDVGVAVAETPVGPFRIVGHFPPEAGKEAGDISAFVDPENGIGWLAYSRKPFEGERRVLRLCRMGPQLTSILHGECVTVPGSEGLEAPALMHEPT